MQNHSVISRKDARDAGRRRFFTGRPCKRGHLSERFVTTGNCVACNAERTKASTVLTNQTRTAHAQGRFFYDLHPDDHARVLAFCQAVDMERGRIPSSPPAPVPPPTPEGVAAAIKQSRDRLLMHIDWSKSDDGPMESWTPGGFVR